MEFIRLYDTREGVPYCTFPSLSNHHQACGYSPINIRVTLTSFCLVSDQCKHPGAKQAIRLDCVSRYE
jgi:hypothetical protein